MMSNRKCSAFSRFVRQHGGWNSRRVRGDGESEGKSGCVSVGEIAGRVFRKKERTSNRME